MAVSTDTSVLYLDRLDRYNDEKPFEVLFNTSGFGEDASQGNVILVPENVAVRNARHSTEAFTLDKNGFQVVDFESRLQGDDFEDKEKVQSIYFEEAKACLRQIIPGSVEMHILNYKVYIDKLISPRKANAEAWHLDQATKCRISCDNIRRKHIFATYTFGP